MTAPATDPIDDSLGYTQIIEQTLASWGLSDLNTLVEGLGTSGASQDEISLQIQNSPEYKTRFAGNATRIANGLAALDPATYISLEGQYKQILGQLPTGFYDDKASIDGFIGGDVSPSELSDRVSLANSAYVNAPQSARDAWDSYQGTSGVGGAIAAILDTSTAEPLLQSQVTQAGIGGAALSQGLALTSASKAMQAAQQGVTIDQARSAYQAIAGRLQSDSAQSGRFSNAATGTFDQGAEENADLLGSAAAIQQRKTLNTEESSQFAAAGGADPTGGNNPGSNY